MGHSLNPKAMSDKPDEHQVHEDVKNDPVAMFASEEDLLIYDHFYRNGIGSKNKEMQGLIEIHHAQDEDLEEERDSFAMMFANWLSLNNWAPMTSGGLWQKYDQGGTTRGTTADLLELYKQSLLNG